MANFEKTPKHAKKEKSYIDYLREAAQYSDVYKEYLTRNGRIKKIKIIEDEPEGEPVDNLFDID